MPQDTEIQRSLGRIEGQLLSIGQTFTQHIQDDAANFKEININFSAMQRKVWTYSGFVFAIIFGITHLKDIVALIK